MIKKTLKSLILGLAMLVGGTAVAQNDNFNGRALTDGLEISLFGSNDRFLSSENGNRNMRCNRTRIGAWERFIVDVVSSNPMRVRLIASNGNYVSVNSDNTLEATSNNIGNAAVFTSDDNANNAGQHTLAIRGSFLSSENGTRDVRANRSSVGRWERWDVSSR